MIRGAIDYITPERIGGWLHSDKEVLRDKIVLAFMDEACIGSGTVNLFRQDIADSGLSDGFSGFSFSISLKNSGDIGRVTIRLEGSDPVFLQPGSRVMGALVAEQLRETYEMAPHRVSSLQWMRARHWLNQADYDFLFYVDQMGIYDKSIPREMLRSEVTGERLKEPSQLAKELFELYYMQDVGLHENKCDSISEIGTMLAGLAPPPARMHQIVAIWSPERTRISIFEGAHTAQNGGTSALQDTDQSAASVEYVAGPDRLICVNSRCFGKGYPNSTPNSLTVFSPVFS